MPTITAENDIVTHINVFTTAPERQQMLVDSLIETVNAAREVPGWLSASIHRSFDGTKVTNYVQFANHAAADAVLRHLAKGGFLQRNAALGQVAPGQYEVAYTISAA
ncbi:antibiotic biosynthesis monooxygenase [Phreatobacter stygius]|uniref:Antibiotic biosynthesis monooxygenase n=1 Tax=Phreatobacter stygius TaxID=1940610 RepID=A0A4D7BAH5_9HYPH|nr:antibiotic biosynthesis monooxygenase [Phreatobacter stygius]QCI67640.1 antibiotic biosynthesis monooxygenase [Phreatobacter stygius]